MEIYRMPLQEIIWDDFKIIATIHSLSQNNILLLKYIFYKKKEDEYVCICISKKKPDECREVSWKWGW